MKLLFDENISFRLINKIIDVFPEAKQVRALGLESTNDSDIWAYAKDNGFTIVTFDADFIRYGTSQRYSAQNYLAKDWKYDNQSHCEVAYATQ